MSNAATFAVIAIALGLNPVLAQVPVVRPPLAIVHVRALTMDPTRGDVAGDPLGTIEDATLVIADGKIAAIGSAAATAVPDGAIVHDGLGRTVLPALCDLHVHLFGGGGASPDGDPLAAARRTLEYGITTVLDLNAPDGEFFALRDRERAERRALYPVLPRIHGSGSAIAVAGGHGTEGDSAALVFPANARTDDAVGKAALEEFADRVIARRPDFVKVMADAGGCGGLPVRPTFDTESLRRCLSALHARGARVALHAIDAHTARVAADSGVELIAHLPFATTLAATDLAGSRTALTPTLAVYDALVRSLDRRTITLRPADGPRGTRFAFDLAATEYRPLARFLEGRLPELRRELLALHRAGVRLLPGSDAGQPNVPHGEGLIRELELWCESGVPCGEVLRAATRSAAEFLETQDHLGALIPGFDADVLLVDGNPGRRIEDLRRVVLVVKQGEPVAITGLARQSLTRAEDSRLPFLERRRLLDYDDAATQLPLPFGREATVENALSIARVAVTSPPWPEGDIACLRVVGRQSELPAAEPKLGVRFDLAANAPGFDLSGFTALRFLARAEVPLTVRLIAITSDVRDGDYFGQTIALDPVLTTVRIEFRELTQIGFGTRGTFDPGKVTAIAIAFDSSVAGEQAFEFDELTVER